MNIQTNTGLYNTRLNSPILLSNLCVQIDYLSYEQLKELIIRTNDNSNVFVMQAKKLLKTSKN
jgi:hypothetical protein